MKANKLFWILWLIWLGLNLLTCLMQEIYTDESYYHLYGQYLAWGYYDHPPMVGLMAWLSDHIMCHTHILGLRNLTVRLMTLLTHALTVWMLWKTTTQDRKIQTSTVWTFFMIAAGMVMFCTAGFMLTPDSPLLLFVALFYYAYQRYLKGENLWQWAAVIGFAIAGMLYSKYMGVLVVAFTVLGNWRLIKDSKLWCAIGLAIALLIPHMWWQYSHEFPSLQYHLIARHDGFSLSAILDYWPNQLVVFNPLSLALMLCAGIVAIRRRKENIYECSLATTILGFLFFFWTMTLKGHAEPHWTMAASIPAIILLTRYMEDGWIAWMEKKWVRTTLWVMVGLCMIARIVLWTNLLPINTGLGSKHARYDSIHDLSGDRVVVIKGSFQWPSMYRFWVGDAVLTHDIAERHTQYELVDLDYQYQGLPASIIEYCPGSIDTVLRDQTFPWKLVDHLQLTDRIQIKESSISIIGDSLCGSIAVFNPYAVPFNWQHTEMPVQLHIVSLQEDWFYFAPCEISGEAIIQPQDSATYLFKTSWRGLTHQDTPNEIKYIWSLGNGVANTQNSKPQSLVQL